MLGTLLDKGSRGPLPALKRPVALAYRRTAHGRELPIGQPTRSTHDVYPGLMAQIAERSADGRSIFQATVQAPHGFFGLARCNQAITRPHRSRHACHGHLASSIKRLLIFLK